MTRRAAATHSRLYECEEVGVNLIRMRGRHAVRETRVGLQRAMLQKFDRSCSRSWEGANLVVLTMHHQYRNVDYLEIVVELGFGEGP